MRRSHVALLAGTLAVLTASGAGIAYAATTGALDLSVTAAAATPAINQTNDVTALNFTYNEGEEAFATAGAVTIANTGSREASYSLTLTPHDASVPGLPAEISVSVGSVASVGDCSVAATLGNPQDGSLASTFVYNSASIPLKLAAGTSVVLCVKTTIDDEHIGEYGLTSLSVDLTGTLVYAAGAPWTVAATAVTVEQDVIAADLALLFDNPFGRYWIHNGYFTGETFTSLGQICKFTTSPNSPGRDASCMGGDHQWRLLPSGAIENNEWFILNNLDSFAQPDVPAWTYTDSATKIQNNVLTQATNQRWKLEGRGDGTYRIRTVAEASPTCIEVSHDPGQNVWWEPNTGNPLRLRPAPCDNLSQYQGFRFTLIGYPVPATAGYPSGYPLVCTGSTWYREFSWTETYAGGGNDYKKEMEYRLVFRTQDMPGGPPGQIQTPVTWHYNDGGWRVIQIHNNNGINGTTGTNMNNLTNLEAWWQATYGNTTGTHTMDAWVEERITVLGAWTTVTTTKQVPVTRTGASSFQVGCS